jgi:hypothetical protein
MFTFAEGVTTDLAGLATTVGNIGGAMIGVVLVFLGIKWARKVMQG